ncbi:MAG: hypothetical protein AB1711_01220 [Thermodesulfobacteriota bacterium]
MRKLLMVANVLMFLLLPVMMAWAEGPTDILVIANKGVALDSISKDTLADLFLKKKGVKDNAGNDLVPINAPEGSPLRDAWAKRVLGMDAGSEVAYWKKMLVASGTQAPKSLPNTMAAAFSVKGAISYIKRSDYKEGVAKVLAVIP